MFQAKLKLEMEIEQTKKRVQKESDRRQEDMEEMKSNYTRKVTIMFSFLLIKLSDVLICYCCCFWDLVILIRRKPSMMFADLLFAMIGIENIYSTHSVPTKYID